MRKRTFVWPAGVLAVALLTAGACGGGGSSNSTPMATSAGTAASTNNGPVKLTIFAAGTLANPFNTIDKAFSAKYPNVTVQPQFGGSVKEVKQVTELKQQADIVGVADYSVIPKYMFGAGGKPRYANWYIGFVSNAITFVYTSKSKGASQITPQNWYTVLAEPGVQIGRSNPDTDPSGYQTLQMLKLAETYYGKPGLSDAILKNAPQKNIRDTETELLGALEAGQIDYLAIYKSDALQHHLKYLDLPPDINLSDASKFAAYKAAVVHTANGALTAAPIIYALTIPTNAPHADWALKWLEFALGPEGRKVMSDAGFGIVSPALASNVASVPAALQGLVVQWPGQ